MYYSSLVWAQNFNFTKRLFILQKKALRLMFFLRREAHTNPLFKDFNILKFHDKIALENSIFIHKSFKHQLPQPFDNWFGLSSNFHTHNTRWSNLGCLNVPSHRTKLYGRNSVCISAIFTWNYLQNLHRNILFHKLAFIKPSWWWHRGMWKWRFLYWFSAWSHIGIEDQLLI